MGEWSRQHNFPLEQNISYDSTSWGDITFSVDSTFIIRGDSPKGNSTLSLSGWYSGEETTGTWKIEKNLLRLYPDFMDRKFPMTFKIVTLTSQKLVLFPLLYETDTDSTKYLTYLRKP